jgi:hypothetical protein
MAEKKLFSKVRRLVVVGTIAGVGALMTSCSSSDKMADKSCGGRRMDAADFDHKCGKSCGGKAGDKSCGQKSCGQKSCGGK